MFGICYCALSYASETITYLDSTYLPAFLPFFRIAMRCSQNFLLLFHYKVFKEAMTFELQYARTLSLEWILMQYFITSLVTVFKKGALNSSLMMLKIKIEFPETFFFWGFGHVFGVSYHCAPVWGTALDSARYIKFFPTVIIISPFCNKSFSIGNLT